MAFLRAVVKSGHFDEIMAWWPTLAVVLDHVLKASPAASMAAFVSATPKSGTDPRTSVVAGSFVSSSNLGFEQTLRIDVLETSIIWLSV